MSKASQVFGALRSQMLGRKDVWNCVKARVMVTMVIPTMLDGLECCVVTAAMMRAMESQYLRQVRSCLRVTPYTQRKHKLTSMQLLTRLGVFPLHHYLDLKVLAYAGHVNRMPLERLPRVTRNCTMTGPRHIGRPAKSHMHNIEEGMRRKQISVCDWKKLSCNKNIWAKLIRHW